jgi:hypothetical protein
MIGVISRKRIKQLPRLLSLGNRIEKIISGL